jgi:tagatose 6-phosphate kinase
MAGDVIVTVTLNAALHVGYAAADGTAAAGVVAVSRPSYRAGGRGVTAARLLRSFGHDVLAAGLAGGSSGELIREDLARSGVPAAFTLARGESRRIYRFTGPRHGMLRFAEPGPYITTEELGRFAADYRRLLAGAAAVVLCGSLPDGLPPDIYGTLVTYAAEAGVPAILDAGGEELSHAIRHRPALVVADLDRAGDGADLVRRGAGAAAVTCGDVVRAVTPAGQWTARLAVPGAAAPWRPARGALVAGLVPGQLLGWSWPDRLRHALALAAAAATASGAAGDGGRRGGDPDPPGDARDRVDLAAYERLLDAVTVEAPG